MDTRYLHSNQLLTFSTVKQHVLRGPAAAGFVHHPLRYLRALLGVENVGAGVALKPRAGTPGARQPERILAAHAQGTIKHSSTHAYCGDAHQDRSSPGTVAKNSPRCVFLSGGETHNRPAGNSAASHKWHVRTQSPGFQRVAGAAGTCSPPRRRWRGSLRQPNRHTACCHSSDVGSSTRERRNNTRRTGETASRQRRSTGRAGHRGSKCARQHDPCKHT